MEESINELIDRSLSPSSITEPSSITSMAKDTRVTFDSATNNNNGTNGAMSPNGVGGGPGGGGGGPGGFSLGHHHNSLAPHQQPLPSHHHSHHPHKPSSKMGRGHSRIAERQVSTEDAENCINEISESFPALSNKAHRLMRQVSGSFNSRTLKVALIFSIMLNIVMGISFGVFFGMWMSWDRSSGADGEIDRISGSRSNPGHISNLPHTLPYYYPPPKTDIHTDTHAKNKNPFEAVCAYCSTIPCSQSPSTVGVSPGNGGKDKCVSTSLRHVDVISYSICSCCLPPPHAPPLQQPPPLSSHLHSHIPPPPLPSSLVLPSPPPASPFFLFLSFFDHLFHLVLHPIIILSCLLK